MGYCFVPECNHAQERLHTRHFLFVFFFFFFAIFVGPRFVEIQEFCYHGNVK